MSPTPTASTSTPADAPLVSAADLAQDDAIREALHHLETKHPTLRKLVGLVHETLEVTPEFVRAYHASSVNYATRSLVLRVLLAEQVGRLPAEHARLSRAVLQRAVDWWRANGALAGGYVARETTPKAFATLLGTSRSSFSTLVAEAAVMPLFSLDASGRTNWPAYRGLSAEDLTPMRELVAARHLTRATADALVAPGAERAPSELVWWFRTGDSTLDLRNSLVYLARLFARDRDGGRVQNLLPKPLTDRWNLRRLSVPEALAFCDVVVLAYDGLIDLHAIAPANDWMGLANDLRAARRRWVGQIDPDLHAALAAHRARWRVTADIVARRRQLQEEGAREGTYDSSFLMNLTRQVSSEKDAPESNLRRFATYYAAIDPDALLSSYAAQWSAASGEIQSRLIAWMVGTEVPGVSARPMLGLQLRDIGNTLAFLAHLDITDAGEASRVLPSVARWTLGELPPQASGKRKASKKARPRGVAPTTRSERALPLLDALWSQRPRAALLAPGYRGEMPTELPVYVHAVHAAGWSTPPGVTVIGTAPAPWGADPVQLAITELTNRGLQVLRLG